MARRTQGKYGSGREALMRATMHVVAEQGLRGMTYRAVAEEAGVDNSLVAHHFGTRDALIAQTLEWSTTQAIESSRLAEFAESPDGFHDALMKTLLPDPDVHLFQFEMVLEARRRPDIAESVHRLYVAYTDALAQSARALAGRPLQDDAARAAFAGIDGLVLQFVAGAIDREQLERSLRVVWDVVKASAIDSS